jgi:hypothetical protein
MVNKEDNKSLNEINRKLASQAPCGLDNISEDDLVEALVGFVRFDAGVEEEAVFVALSNGKEWDGCQEQGDSFFVEMSADDAGVVLRCLFEKTVEEAVNDFESFGPAHLSHVSSFCDGMFPTKEF